MTKIDYILLIGISCIIISIFMFTFIREDVTPNCIESIECNTATNYFDALKPDPICDLICRENIDNTTFNIPNQNFIIFVQLGVLLVGLWSTIKICLFTIKTFRKIMKKI